MTSSRLLIASTLLLGSLCWIPRDTHAWMSSSQPMRAITKSITTKMPRPFVPPLLGMSKKDPQDDPVPPSSPSQQHTLQHAIRSHLNQVENSITNYDEHALDVLYKLKLELEQWQHSVHQELLHGQQQPENLNHKHSNNNNDHKDSIGVAGIGATMASTTSSSSIPEDIDTPFPSMSTASNEEFQLDDPALLMMAQQSIANNNNTNNHTNNHNELMSISGASSFTPNNNTKYQVHFQPLLSQQEYQRVFGRNQTDTVVNHTTSMTLPQTNDDDKNHHHHASLMAVRDESSSEHGTPNHNNHTKYEPSFQPVLSDDEYRKAFGLLAKDKNNKDTPSNNHIHNDTSVIGDLTPTSITRNWHAQRNQQQKLVTVSESFVGEPNNDTKYQPSFQPVLSDAEYRKAFFGGSNMDNETRVGDLTPTSITRDWHAQRNQKEQQTLVTVSESFVGAPNNDTKYQPSFQSVLSDQEYRKAFGLVAEQQQQRSSVMTMSKSQDNQERQGQPLPQHTSTTSRPIIKSIPPNNPVDHYHSHHYKESQWSTTNKSKTTISSSSSSSSSSTSNYWPAAAWNTRTPRQVFPSVSNGRVHVQPPSSSSFAPWGRRPAGVAPPPWNSHGTTVTSASGATDDDTPSSNIPILPHILSEEELQLTHSVVQALEDIHAEMNRQDERALQLLEGISKSFQQLADVDHYHDILAVPEHDDDDMSSTGSRNGVLEDIPDEDADLWSNVGSSFSSSSATASTAVSSSSQSTSSFPSFDNSIRGDQNNKIHQELLELEQLSQHFDQVLFELPGFPTTKEASGSSDHGGADGGDKNGRPANEDDGLVDQKLQLLIQDIHAGFVDIKTSLSSLLRSPAADSLEIEKMPSFNATSTDVSDDLPYGNVRP